MLILMGVGKGIGDLGGTFSCRFEEFGHLLF